MKKQKKIRTSLRLIISLSSIFTFCFACCISCFMVCLGMYLFFRGTVTVEIAVTMCLLVCGLSMLFGGFFLWIGAAHVTKPIGKVIEAVKLVAQGDFSVQVQRNAEYRKGFEYTNEIDELAENFNKMTRELHGMDYMRKDFMSNVSHEFKTPIAAITGFTEILMDGGLEEAEQQEYLSLVNQQSVRLSRLCENMLRMSRLDNQVIVEKKDEIKIDEQIRKCIILLAEKWSSHEMNFELDLDNCVVKSDYDLLYQVWMNLIDNAMKYSEKGKTIWITAKRTEDFVQVTIKDEGIGINKEKQNKIFDKFYQCEESHKKQGSGLGLSIVKRITELLEGKIFCESVEKKGTTMTVLLPMR